MPQQATWCAVVTVSTGLSSQHTEMSANSSSNKTKRGRRACPRRHKDGTHHRLDRAQANKHKHHNFTQEIPDKNQSNLGVSSSWVQVQLQMQGEKRMTWWSLPNALFTFVGAKFIVLYYIRTCLLHGCCWQILFVSSTIHSCASLTARRWWISCGSSWHYWRSHQPSCWTVVS